MIVPKSTEPLSYSKTFEFPRQELQTSTISLFVKFMFVSVSFASYYGTLVLMKTMHKLKHLILLIKQFLSPSF
jgi:hypothetical protein